MEKTFRHWTVSDFIKHLIAVKEQKGDLPVYMASDEEGNRFQRTGEINEFVSVYAGTMGDIDENTDTPEKEICVLWPFD